MGQYIGQSFTEAGAGNSVGVDPGEAVSFAASGTYTGAITVERSRDNGATWQAALVGGSGAVFSGFYKNESGGPERYRLASTVATGTAVTKINDIERVPMAIPGEARASHTVTGPLVFSPGDPAEKGSCLMRLVADGTNAPDFSAFVLVGAGEWVNTAAAVNIVQFFRLGGVDYYSVAQAA